MYYLFIILLTFNLNNFYLINLMDILSYFEDSFVPKP